MPRRTRTGVEPQQNPDPPAAPEWAEHYPDRWQHELTALRATGWTHTVSQQPSGVVLDLDYPLPPDLAEAVLDRSHRSTEEQPTREEPGLPPDLLPLEVWFPAQYPFFAPTVTDRDKRLRLRRHRNPRGVLCLIEGEDWQVETTVAGLLATQLPRLLRAATGDAPAEPGLEVRRPEPVAVQLPGVTVAEAVIMPNQQPDPGAGEGALVVKYALRAGGVLGAALVERILGEGIDISGPAERMRPGFRLVSYGRWARDPDFDPAEAPEVTYRRLGARLAPLRVDDPGLTASAGDASVDRDGLVVMAPEALETLCLLVPSERGYRHADEEWVAVQRSDFEGQPHCRYLPVQHIGGDGAAARTPETRPMAKRHAVIVGVGALGAHVAIDLARTGIGRLDLVDGDQVDVATASRQYAPVFAAGRPKAEALASHLFVGHPDTTTRVFDLTVGHPDLSEHQRTHRRQLEQRLRAADLVIDATAAPAVTRYLAAVRQAHRLDFLHLSATAGAWGGCVFLATPDTGCWSCLQHHRLDGAVPVPPVDPAGTITPPGCADPSFTGTNPDLATIAHHASRVAVARLLGSRGLGGDLYVARLRSRDGTPRPISWRAVAVPAHPDCPLHPGAAAALGADEHRTVKTP